MGSSADFGFDNHYEKQRAIAATRLKTGVDSISPDQIYAATQSLDQMKWKINNLHLTQVEYREWHGFIDALSKLLPEVRK